MRIFATPRSLSLAAFRQFVLWALSPFLLLAGTCRMAVAQTAQAGATVTLASGFNALQGIAVDGSGNVYVADANNNAVEEVPAGCVTSMCIVMLPGSFNSPQSVAVDGSGNVYVADSGNGLVKVIPFGCLSGCVRSLGGGFVHPYGVAVDGSGTVYVADGGTNTVTKLPSGCATSGCVTTLGGGFSNPTRLALDGSGNVYVTDYGHNAVKEIPAGCVLANCVTTLGGGFSSPDGITLDGSGNVYVADKGNNAVKKMSLGCLVANCVTTLGSFTNPVGVGVDQNGNVYVAVNGNNTVEEIFPSAVNAQSVNVGTTGTTFAVHFTITGNGTFETPAVLTQGVTGLDFAYVAGGSTCSGPLTSGTTCTVNVAFTPTAAGPRRGRGGDGRRQRYGAGDRLCLRHGSRAAGDLSTVCAVAGSSGEPFCQSH